MTSIQNASFIFLSRNSVFVNFRDFILLYNCVGTTLYSIKNEHSVIKISILKYKINLLVSEAEKTPFVTKTNLLTIAVYSEKAEDGTNAFCKQNAVSS